MRFEIAEQDLPSYLGATGEADSNWKAAMSEAAGHHEAMTQLLQLSESWHLEQNPQP